MTTSTRGFGNTNRIEERQLRNQKERDRFMWGGSGEQKIGRSHLVRTISGGKDRKIGWEQIKPGLWNPLSMFIHNPNLRENYQKV